jgi:transcriptional regulator with XRE-family HTH domain
MNFSNHLWNRFAESKEYREEYAAALAKRAFSLQIRAIRKSRKLSQEELATAARIDQGVISRAENPNYGNLSFNTAIRISAGFDLAFIPQIVTYSQFAKWAESVASGVPNLPTFEQEQETAKGETEREKAARLVASIPSSYGYQNVVTGEAFTRAQLRVLGSAQPVEKSPTGAHEEVARKEPQGEHHAIVSNISGQSYGLGRSLGLESARQNPISAHHR